MGESGLPARLLAVAGTALLICASGPIHPAGAQETPGPDASNAPPSTTAAPSTTTPPSEATSSKATSPTVVSSTATPSLSNPMKISLPPLESLVPPPVRRPTPHENPTRDKQCVESSVQGELDKIPSAQKQLRFEDAWRFATGRDQKVAVIDTGVTEHPRFEGRLEPGGDYVGSQDGTEDCDGHGTHVAGIIAASRPSTPGGFAGVAPDARVLAIRQSSSRFSVAGKEPNQKVPAGDEESLAMAITWAASQGVSVINISQASCVTHDYLPLRAAVRSAVEEHNVVIVAAAANVSQSCPQNSVDKINTVVAPAWHDEYVLTVGSLDERGNPSKFSILGPWVDVAAPGERIISLDPKGPGLTNSVVDPNGQRGFIQGTSFAAPYVAGTVALVRERFPELRAKEVMERIKRTAHHSTGAHGRSFDVGYGMIDPYAAVTAIIPEEKGVKPAGNNPRPMTIDLNKPSPLPMIVAVGGTVGAFTLLGMTLFIVNATRRSRRRSTRP